MDSPKYNVLQLPPYSNSGRPTPQPGTKAVLAGLAKIRKDETTTDFTLQSPSGNTHKVHKLVLLMHSDALHRMAVSEHFWECHNKTIIFKETEDSCVEALADFLYGQPLEHETYFPKKQWDEETTQADLAARVHHFVGLWQLGDMYEMRRLKKAAVIGFATWFKSEHAIVKRIDWILETIAGIEDFPERMWKAIIRTCVKEFTDRNVYDAWKTDELFKKYPDFAREILQKILRVNQWRELTDPDMLSEGDSDRE